MKNVLFVCTGNTCRSPMAEAILKKVGADQFQVKSAGIVARDGDHAYPHVKTILQKRGISINHRSQRVTPELLDWADVILTMTQGHKATLIQQFPEMIDKVMTLKEAAHDEEARNGWQETMADYQMKRVLYEKAVKDDQPEAVIKEKEYDVQVALEHVQHLEMKEMDLDIEDPFGATEKKYEEVCREIEEMVKQFMAKVV